MTSWHPPAEGRPLLLNFHNHCLLCLQHVDPLTLQAIATENPKGLTDFQPVLQYLTGTTDQASSSCFPVTSEMPPLCTVCYDILAEIHTFHNELLELKRKLENQTEAARRIAKATTRKRGGMRNEFFKRLNAGGLPKKQVGQLQGFLENFHGLMDNGKEVVSGVELMTLEQLTTSGGYLVKFAEPKIAGQEEEPEVVELEDDQDEEGTVPGLEFEYEGDEEEEEDKKPEVDEEEDVDYWRSVLSSQVIIEDVPNEEEVEEEREEIEVTNKKEVEVECIDLDDDEDEEDDEEEFEMEYTEGLNYQPVILEVRGGVEQQSNVVSSSLKTKRVNNGRGVYQYNCGTCGKGYHTKQRLKYHEEGHLPGGRPKPFECGACGKTFAAKKLLEQHTRIHTGERPFACEVCGDRFRQGSTLYRHKMAHQRQQMGLNNRRSRLGEGRNSL